MIDLASVDNESHRSPITPRFDQVMFEREEIEQILEDPDEVRSASFYRNSSPKESETETSKREDMACANETLG